MRANQMTQTATIRNPLVEENDWWIGAVIYQIYPRSFKDSNHNGVGDLRGIIEKMGYIADLGVDAIWVSPFFASPMRDFGYDISDYRSVDPLFGTLKDFDDLISCAHSYGLKVMIDQVLSHTSIDHEWFKESRKSRFNAKADWYVWADPAEDGGPPNNWLSIFGGGAWEWDDVREQYYFHNFLKSQPDLNFHCEALRNQVLEEVEFWLQRGVDGLRLDAINFCYHDKQLRNNPAKPAALRKDIGFCKGNPYTAQYHIYDNTQVQNLAFLEDLRRLLNRYPGVASLGEINSENSLATIAEYTSGDKRLHLGYSFELLAEESSAKYIRQTVEKLEDKLAGSWPCWAISNHDVERVLSRWGDGQSPELAKLYTAIVASLRGAVCTYQGEELGLPEVCLRYEQIQDPYGKEFWPEYKGRDGCRTPMPWVTNGANGGFSENHSWLPIPEIHSVRSVAAQQLDENSVLNAYRNFLHWRKIQPAMKYGEQKFLDFGEGILAFTRSYTRQCILAIFNLSAEMKQITVGQFSILKPIQIKGFEQGCVDCDRITLPPGRLVFCEVSSV